MPAGPAVDRECGMNLAKTRIAVVSPFVDKRHGTERCLAEQIERLAADYEIHLFSSRVEDVDLSQVTWHRVPGIPGPHIVSYAWWFATNHLWRWSESIKTGKKFALVYSPGVNCLDADVILVHHIFAEHRDRLRGRLQLHSQPPAAWLRAIHRKFFYACIGWLEGRLYRRRGLALAAVSRAAAVDIEKRFHPSGRVATIHHGVNVVEFNPGARTRERDRARHRFGFRENDFVLLLVGNDWEKKGLPCLTKALHEVGDSPVFALVVGSDHPDSYRLQAQRMGVAERIRFAGVSSEVMQFYAAADACVAPSIYDPFGLPVLEAMACGLPVIASRAMGASELIANGHNGLILEEPQDVSALAAMICLIFADTDLRRRLASAAAETASRFTWDANASAIAQQFENALLQSRRSESMATGKA